MSLLEDLMNTVSDYLKDLKEALSEFGSEENLNKLKIAEGASVVDIERLKKNILIVQKQ